MGKQVINYNFKLFSAIAMVLVVAGHILPWNTSLFYGLFPLYTFHVAAFVFVSGYFYKTSYEQDLKGFLIKKVKSLIIPMYVIYTIYAGILIVMQHIGFSYGPKEITLSTLLALPWTNGTHLRINKAMWFISALFVAELANVVIRSLAGKVCKPTLRFELALFALYMVLGSVGMYFGGQGDGITGSTYMAVWRGFFFLSCIGMGRIYKVLLEKHDTLGSLPYFIIVLGIQLAISLAGLNISCNISKGYFPNNFAISYLQVITGLAMLLRVCKILGPSIGKSKVVLAVANNTFSIMNHHYFVLILMSGAIGLIGTLGAPLLNAFDWAKYLSSDLYFFMPGDCMAFSLVYTAGSIAACVGLHAIWKKIKQLGLSLAKDKG